MPKISNLRVGDVVRAHGSSGHVIRKDWSPGEGDYVVVEMSDGLHTITDHDRFTVGGGRKRGKRQGAKRTRSYSAKKKARIRAVRRHPAIRRMQARSYVNRIGRKIRKRAQQRHAAKMKNIRAAVLDRYNAGRHDEAVDILKQHANDLGLSAKKLHETPATEAVFDGLKALAKAGAED